MEQQLKAIFLETLKEAYSSGFIPHPVQQNDGGSPWRNAAGIAEYLGFEVNWVRKHMLHLARRPANSDPRWNIHEVDKWIIEADMPTQQTEPNLTISKRSRHVKLRKK